MSEVTLYDTGVHPTPRALLESEMPRIVADFIAGATRAKVLTVIPRGKRERLKRAFTCKARPQSGLDTFTWKARPKYGLDFLVCAIFARERDAAHRR